MQVSVEPMWVKCPKGGRRLLYPKTFCRSEKQGLQGKEAASRPTSNRARVWMIRDGFFPTALGGVGVDVGKQAASRPISKAGRSARIWAVVPHHPYLGSDPLASCVLFD